MILENINETTLDGVVEKEMLRDIETGKFFLFKVGEFNKIRITKKNLRNKKTEIIRGEL